MAKLAEDVRSKCNVMPIDIINMTPKLTPFIFGRRQQICNKHSAP